MKDADLAASVQAAIAQLHAAMASVANGDVSAIKALYSHTPDATSFYGWGGYEKGWEAATQFKGGQVRYENVSTVITPGMFLVTDIETYGPQRMANVEGETGWTNRVTHVFRKEAGEWRLVHRHGNRLETQYEPSARLGR
jgi:ketosteroid isomerase-like protein